MPTLPGTRIRNNGVVGTIADNPLVVGASSFNSPDLVKLGTVSGDHAIITFDPLRQFGEPEIVMVTVHTAASTTATITRGMYATNARTHPISTLWVHAAVTNDFIEIVTSSFRPTNPYRGQLIYETDTDLYKTFNGTVWNSISSGDSVGATVTNSIAPFSLPGILATEVGRGRFLFPFPVTILGCSAAVNTPSSGSSIIFDVNRNGTTMYTTQPNRPTILAGSNAASETVPDVTSIVTGQYLTVDTDQIGSIDSGRDASVFIRYVRV